MKLPRSPPRALRAAAGTLRVHPGSAAEQVPAAGGFPGRGAPLWKRSSLCPERWDGAKRSRRRPGLLPHHRQAPPSPRRAVLVPPTAHRWALRTQPRLLARGGERGADPSTAGTGMTGNSLVIFRGSLWACLKTFLNKKAKNSLWLSPQTPQHPHVSQVTQHRAPCDQESPGKRTRSLSSARPEGRHGKPKVCPH